MLDAQLVATRFRQARTDAGLSQYAIHKRTGLTLTEIGNWEHGRLRRPGWGVVVAIARVLEVSPFWLMGQDKSEEGDISLSEDVIAGRVMLNLSITVIEETVPDLGELMLFWAVLPADQQKIVAKYIKWEALQCMGGVLGDTGSDRLDLGQRAREKFRTKARAVMAKKRAAAKPQD